MNICIISEFISSKQNSTGYFWENIILNFKDNGFSVSAITSEHDLLANSKNNLFVRTLKRILITAKLSIKTLIQKKKDTIFLSGTNPELLLLFLAVVTKFSRRRWYVLVHDIFPYNLVPAEILGKNSFLLKILEFIYKWVFNQPECLIVIGRDMVAKLVELGVKESRIKYIPNFVNLSEINIIPRAESTIINKHNLKEKIIFQFFGNFGVLQDLEIILEATKYVTNENAHFLFIGDGVYRNEIINFVTENKSKNILVLDYIQKNERNEGLAACDVSLVSLKKGMRGLAVPSKTYFSLAAGKPILAIMEKDTEIEMLLNEYNIGWHFLPSDPKSLAMKIDEICLCDFVSISKNCRSIIETHFSSKVVLEQYIQLFR